MADGKCDCKFGTLREIRGLQFYDPPPTEEIDLGSGRPQRIYSPTETMILRIAYIDGSNFETSSFTGNQRPLAANYESKWAFLLPIRPTYHDYAEMMGMTDKN